MKKSINHDYMRKYEYLIPPVSVKKSACIKTVYIKTDSSNPS